MEIDAIRVLDDGIVEIWDADGSAWATKVWAYSPAGPPQARDEIESLTHIDGDWYSYTYDW